MTSWKIYFCQLPKNCQKAQPCFRITLNEHRYKLICSTSHSNIAQSETLNRKSSRNLENSRNHEKDDCQGSADPRLTCQGRPSTSSGTSAMLCTATRPAPFSPKFFQVFYEMLGVQNDLQKVELKQKQCSKWRPCLIYTSYTSVLDILRTRSALLPN